MLGWNGVTVEMFLGSVRSSVCAGEIRISCGEDFTSFRSGESPGVDSADALGRGCPIKHELCLACVKKIAFNLN